MNKTILKKQKKIIYDIMNCKEYKPMRAKELAGLLELPKGNKRQILYEALDSLLADGAIDKSDRGEYQKSKGAVEVKQKRDSTGYVTGKFIGHPKGFGFVELPEEGAEDIFIPESHVESAIHLDEVQVRLLDAGQQKGKRQEGMIVKVLSHGIHEIIGTFQRSRNFGFVISDNVRFSKDIFVPMEQSLGAITGDKVIVTLTSYGSNNKNPQGKVTEILGQFDQAGVDILAIAKGYGLPMEFPAKVLRQAERIKLHLLEEDLTDRMDLRDSMVVTIDGEDAKDLDDGISLTQKGNIYHLGVHIADVSNYVQYNSALDKEALKRGTSTYLVDRVIPMLPERLSNGICSLNQGEDRLTLSCLMDIDKKGNVISHQIAETVIRVNQRMTYTNVQKILEKDETVSEKYRELVPLFFQMQELSNLLRKKREKRGSIDFDFPESKIILNKQGKPVDIYPYEQNAATKIIEDFMLSANETVAMEYSQAELPFVYRTHENPDEEKMESVLSMIRSQGIKGVKTRQEIHPKEVQKVLENIAGTPGEAMFSRLILRSMKQARYTTDCSGHFGLAAKYYCHFTSPIRRYPDLQIHRIIKENIRGKLTEQKISHYNEILEEVARQSSAMERRAEEAEREVEKLKKAEYMTMHIGDEFEGIISGVTEWGCYVELENTVEGLLHVNTLSDDYYMFDKEQYQLVGESSKKTYVLGQKIKVQVKDTDLVTKTIDFTLASDNQMI